MDRNVTISVLIALVVVGLLLAWGWKKAVPAAPPTVVALPSPTPRAVYTDTAAVISEAAPSVAPTPNTSYWLWDNALLATRSLDDLFVYQKEDDRPQIGLPNGVTRNDHGQTPKQRELLMAGYIIEVPEAAPVDVISWGSDDMAQVRVREGKKAGSVGWINKHQLRYNHNGVFDSAFPVNVQ